MAKIRLTKNELKKQKDSLKRFRRYLPMLILKKKQLQLERIKVRRLIKETAEKAETLRRDIIRWVDVFAEKVPLTEYCKFKKVEVEEGNVAGIELPVFKAVEFDEKPYDFMLTPLWVDKGLEALKKITKLKAKIFIYHQQMDILKKELRITTQRVNLFEKIKIPQTQENIRVIQIYLGELQTAGVVRGKIAKAKLERKKSLIEL